MTRKTINAIKATRKSRNYSAAFLTLLLALSFAFPIMALPQTVSAQLSIDTYAFLSVGPNPVGVGQKIAIIMWLDKPPPVPAVQTSTLRAIVYTNFTLTVTKPDNTVVKMGPFSSDSTGSTYTSFTLTK